MHINSKAGRVRTLRAFLCTVFASVLVLASAPAKSSKSDDCRKVNAVGVGQDLDGGNTTATISQGGVLNGTTAAHFEITGGTLPVLTFEGTVVFTARGGTLTVGIAGTFNVATGAFSATGPVTGGTGKFAGATGTLTFTGVEDFSTGAFAETITGRICLKDNEDDNEDDD